MLYIHENIRSGALDYLMRGISFLSDSGWIWIVAAIALMLSKKYRRYGFILSAGLLVCLLIGNVTLKPLIGRLRPYDTYEDFLPLINRLRDYSFPSGHTYSAFCGATVLFSANKRLGYAAFTLAALTAFSRVYLLVHYPSDVLAGALLGIGIGVFCLRIVYPLFYNFISFRKREPDGI